MSKRELFCSAAVVLITWAGGSAQESAARPSGQPRDLPNISVRIDNHASVPAETLATAQTQVEEIFALAGVKVRWDGERPRVTLRLVNLTTAGGNPRSSMLGLAVQPERHAFVFWDRVKRIDSARAPEPGIMLGRVMAHELGHLLLPPGPHAHHGAMRGEIGPGPPDHIAFSTSDARRIREALARS